MTGIVSHEGREFSAGGGVVDPARGILIGYPRKVAQAAARGARYVLTLWDGSVVTLLAPTGRFTTPGFGGCNNEIWYWRAVYTGRVYSGRNSGPGMLLRMRAGRDAETRDRAAMKHARVRADRSRTR